MAGNCLILFIIIRHNMLATKHNSCLHVYLSQCLGVSLYLYLHFSKVSVRNREI